MLKLTAAEYAAIHRDYKADPGDPPRCLHMDEDLHGTCSVPVTFVPDDYWAHLCAVSEYTDYLTIFHHLRDAGIECRLPPTGSGAYHRVQVPAVDRAVAEALVRPLIGFQLRAWRLTWDPPSPRPAATTA